MNIATIIGIILGIGLVIGTIFNEAGTLDYFINISGLAIVIGGTFAATFVSYPLPDVIKVFRNVFLVMKREPPRLQLYIKHVLHLVKTAKVEPRKDLEKEIPYITYLFLADAVQMLADGYSVHEINEILEERICYKQEREYAEANVFRSMAKFSPAFGMIGTLIGLILLLVNLSATGLDNLGAGMALALITTFYGVLLSNLVFKPFAIKLERRTQEQILLMNMIKESVIMIAEQWAPGRIEDYLNSFLKPGERRNKHNN